MMPEFVWESDKPEHPPASQVQESLVDALRHFTHEHSISSSVVTVRLWQDRTRTKVDGVGYLQDGTPIVIFYYSLQEPWSHWCNFHENHHK